MPFPAMSPQDAAMLRLNHNSAVAAAGLQHHHPHHHPSVSVGGDSPFSPFSSPPTSMEGRVDGRPPHPPPSFAGGLPPHPHSMGAAHLMSLNSPAAQVWEIFNTYSPFKTVMEFQWELSLYMGTFYICAAWIKINKQDIVRGKKRSIEFFHCSKKSKMLLSCILDKL